MRWFFLLFIFITPSSYAQIDKSNRIDLDDVSIKGEVNKSNQGFTKRAKHSLDSRIQLRTDFRKEILRDLPVEFQKK